MALMFAGMPPIGRGAYVQATVPDGPFRFYVLNAWRADLAEHVATVRARGAEVWLYGGPGRWTVDAWRASLAFIAQKAREVGTTGIVVNPEAGSPDGEEARAFGRAVAALSLDHRVGLAFTPFFHGLPEMAETVGDAVWSAVEVYSQGDGPGNDAAAFRTWFERSRRYFGPRAILSIAGWVPDGEPVLGTPEGYRDYLQKLPHVAGAIAWTTGQLPRHQRAALESWEPGGSATGTAALAALAFMARPAFAALLSGLAVMLAFMFIAWRVARA